MKTFGAAITEALRPLVSTGALLPYRGDWVPPEHQDRLRQYEIFRALAENRFARLLKDRGAASRLREYGDYSLIVETARDAVIGDRVDIEVPGANDEQNPGAAARKALLDEWAKRERWASKIHRGETDAATVGDYVLELRPAGDRLRLRAHDPESFFPVWQNAEGEFDEAYLAWEEENVGQYLPGFSGNLRDLQSRDGEVVLYRRHYELIDVRDQFAHGVTPAALNGRQHICVVTAAWYQIEKDDSQATGWDRFRLLGYEMTADGEPIDRLDTGFDEIPLFYVPNREDTRQPWGLPEGDAILQVLLDLRQDHADLKENTFLNAFPVLYDESPTTPQPSRPGAPVLPSEQKYKPGQIYNGRKLGVVDTSKGNDLLLKHEGFLTKKAMRNSRTSEILAGLIDVGQVPSGYAMMIAMIPTLSKTVAKRVTRRDKLGMLLKHVLRWHRDWANPADYGFDGGWPAGIWDSEEAYPSFGSIVPIDKDQIADIIQKLSLADKISDETAVTMLQAAGFPIDDAEAEVERLRGMREPPIGAPGSNLGNEGLVIPGLETDEDAV